MSAESFHDVEEYNEQFEKVKKRLIAIRDDYQESSISAIKTAPRRHYYILFVPILQIIVLAVQYLFSHPETVISSVDTTITILNYALTIFAFALATLAGFYFVNRMFPPWIFGLICFHLSVSAAERLENNELVGGSFLINKLMKYLHSFSKKEKIKIGECKGDLKTLFLGLVEKLDEQSSVVGKAVVESDAVKDTFVKHLYKLAASIAPYITNSLTWKELGESMTADEIKKDEKEADSKKQHAGSLVNYEEAIKSLDFFEKASQKYFQEEKTLLEKHKTLNTTIKVIVGVGTLVLVPILRFALWLLFGY